MAGKVFCSVSLSLDGCIVPASREDLMGQQWVFPQRFFREHLKAAKGR